MTGHEGDRPTREEFTRAFRAQPAGVAVISADAGHGPVALTASSVISVSVDPPVLAFSIMRSSSSAATILRAQTIVVHLLDHDDLELAQLCATSGVDKFADSTRWTRMPTGEPFFTTARTWIRGKTVRRVAAGGSTLLVLEALQIGGHAASAGRDAPGLVYSHREWHRVGEHSRIASRF